MRKIIIIVGPTGSGKTELSLNLYNKIDAEIISADSMQIYREMDIGTAKANKSITDKYIHHMINIVNPNEDFTVSEFQKKAFLLIDDILLRNKTPIIVGGTGLYINSIVYNLNFANAKPIDKIRAKLWKKFEEYGQDYILNALKDIDIESYHSIDHNNIQRIIRAIEIFETTGNKYSEINKNFREENTDFEFLMYGLTDSRENIYNRINNRVDDMILEGLLDEVKYLMDNYDINSKSFKAIGYKEIIDYYNNLYSYDEAIEKLKQNSRKYAKRQITWFKRDNRIKWFDLRDYNYNYNEISNNIMKDLINE